MEIEFYVDIDRILQSRGMTLTQLADKIGLSKGHLSNIRSTRRINFNSLNKLANGLGVSDPTKLISVEIKETQK